MVLKTLGRLSLFLFLITVASHASSLEGMLRKLEANLPSDGKPSLAVLPFLVKGAEEDLGLLVAEAGIDFFASSGKVSLVDRMNFKSIIEEHKLSDLDLMNPDSAIPIGKLVGARLILAGTITRVYGRDEVHARIIEVATTKVLGAASADFGRGALHQIVDRDTLLHPALFRSAVCPGWGQFWTGDPLHGGIATAAFVGAVGAFVASTVAWDERAVRLRDFRNDTAVHLSAGEYARRQRELAGDQDEAVEWMVWSGAAIGAVWGLNMIDALWLAVRHRRQARNLYFALTPGLRDFGCSLVLRF